MNIKLMLTRLQSAMGRQDLIEQMVLLPPTLHSNWDKSEKSVNLVVGYNSSPSSQTALDLTMWIAHQTRLATQQQVTVQVVYVLDGNQSSECLDNFSLKEKANSTSINQVPLETPEASASMCATPVLTQSRLHNLAACPQATLVDCSYFSSIFYQKEQFEQADQILWQARCLAEEWRAPFKAHLRFGCVPQELKKVVESEAAALLFLGCDSVNHPVVQTLGSNFPCPVLGIPSIET